MTQSTAESPQAAEATDPAKPTAAARPGWWLRDLGRAVDKEIKELQDRFTEGSPVARAQLARLRRGLGKPAGSVPDIWELTVGLVPEKQASQGNDPSHAEQAAHAAMTLYALHQQSHDNDKMHVPGIRFGAAVRRLAAEDGTKGGTKSGVADGGKSAHTKEDEAKDGKEDGRKQAITRRFMAVATAQSINEVLFHVRGLITQLRREKQPLDYAMFAEDVYNLLTPGAENRVRLAWGREFYRTPSADRSDKDAKTPEDSSTSDDDNE